MPSSTKLGLQKTIRERVRLPNEDVLRPSKLLIIGLGYTLLWWALLLWANLAPSSFWFNGNLAVLPATQVMAACGILTPLFIPFVVYFPITNRQQADSISLRPPSSSKPMPGYLRQVITCSLVTLIPLLGVYVMFALMIWFGLITKDLLTPIIMSRSFLFFVVSLTLVTSTTSVGLAISDSRALHFIATAIAASTVLLPSLLSKMVTGTTFEDHLVRWVQGLKTSTAISAFLLLVAILTGCFFSWRFRRKDSYATGHSSTVIR